MPDRVSKSQFKARALQLFRQVETTGRPIIVTDGGVPKLEVRRCRSEARDPLETLRGTVLHYDDPAEPIGVQEWEAGK